MSIKELNVMSEMYKKGRKGDSRHQFFGHLRHEIIHRKCIDIYPLLIALSYSSLYGINFHVQFSSKSGLLSLFK